MQEPGGHRRIDRILAPDYTEGLDGLSLAEVKGRRDECLAEREYLSLLRRLVQGRLDILRAERARREAGSDEGSLVDGLVQALSSEGAPPPTSRGEALRLSEPPEEMALARRQVEGLVADTGISDPRSLSDEELTHAIDRLDAEDRRVSDERAAVLGVHDRLQEELKRRYKVDPSEVLSS